MTDRETTTLRADLPPSTFDTDFNLYWRALEAALLIALDAPLYGVDMRLEHVIASQLRTMLSAVHGIRRAFVSGELGMFELRHFERLQGQLTVLRRVTDVWLGSHEALSVALDQSDFALFALCSMCSQAEQRKVQGLNGYANLQLEELGRLLEAMPRDLAELDVIDRCIYVGAPFVTVPGSYELDPDTEKAAEWVLRANAYFEANKVRDAAAAKVTR